MSEALDAGQRLHRLLAVLAYLAQVGEATIADLAERFAMDEATLVAELELAACCGLPPYTPDQLLELVVDDERVAAFGLEALRRPPRLTPEEGLAVAAAARALLAVPGADAAGPLASGLAKLEGVLGEDRLRVDVDVSLEAALLARAANEHEAVEIDYLGAFRGAESTRVVEPHAVVTREGRSYLDAWCRLARDWRRFALDRISAARPLGETFAARQLPEELEAPGAFTGGGRTLEVELSLPEDRVHLVQPFALGAPERRGDDAVVRLAVADERWLGLLLLRLGPEAKVLSPPGLVAARRVVARRALERYRRAS
ncbi:MAG: pafC [Acidimicrobiaceae bacterium]|nr:pafC [Acidimicrobiaceae bacterium]